MYWIRSINGTPVAYKKMWLSKASVAWQWSHKFFLFNSNFIENTRCQIAAIFAWANADPDLCPHMESLGHNESNYLTIGTINNVLAVISLGWCDIYIGYRSKLWQHVTMTWCAYDTWCKFSCWFQSTHMRRQHNQVGAGLIFSGHVRVDQSSDFFGRGPIFSGQRSWNVWWWFWKLRWAQNTGFSLFLM